jgi:hypothetical protein
MYDSNKYSIRNSIFTNDLKPFVSREFWSDYSVQIVNSFRRTLEKLFEKEDYARPNLFWDTKMESLNWEKQKNAVIRRVFERGNDIEKKVIV